MPDEYLREIHRGVLLLEGRVPPQRDARDAVSKRVGRKGCGLAVLPTAWMPPFLFVDAAVFEQWTHASELGRSKIVEEVCNAAAAVARSWSGRWDKGINVRSSATEETLSERGANRTVELAADFDGPMIGRAVHQIYAQFNESGSPGQMALVVQARVQTQLLGHISNEVRVSKTVNQWMWECEPADHGEGRFNSQRERSPNESVPLRQEGGTTRNLVRKLRQVGRWASQLKAGRTHFEWGNDGTNLWIFQLDFEDDQPDGGVDPTLFLRDGDFLPPGELPDGSPFTVASLEGTDGWPKLDKASMFVADHVGQYPSLIHITGQEFLRSVQNGYNLTADLDAFAHGRIVCRTDCIAPGVSKLNLPRTHTTSSAEAVEFMKKVVSDLGNNGAPSDTICFILHKFIPSVTAAWAVAKLNGNVVRVDALWGLPDGLQYLPHDSFEYDNAISKETSELTRYKHAFLQEAAEGSWEVVRIARQATRWRSLPSQDVAEIADRTQKLANRLQKDVQVMWFCRVPPEAGLTRNIPWFSMSPSDHEVRPVSISPTLRRFRVARLSDLDLAGGLERGRYVLRLEPDDPELFRSQPFLDRVIDICRANEFPVGLTGSILGHAFYVLEKAGLQVVALNEPTRRRTRQRKVFRKLVRDEIPTKITEGGEFVTLAEIAKEEARAALVVKLLEEAHELLAADTPSDVLAELADILEVVRALAHTTGVDWEDVNEAARQKRDARGGFEKSVVLLETSSPAWQAPVRDAGRRTISLEHLGQISSTLDAVNVPFSLLIGGKHRTIPLPDGGQVSVVMDGTGIHLEVADRRPGSDGQLSLPL